MPTICLFRLSGCPSDRLSVCLKPEFGQLFCLSYLNLRGSAERISNKFGPTFYCMYGTSYIFRLSVRPSVCLLSVGLSRTKIGSTFLSDGQQTLVPRSTDVLNTTLLKKVNFIVSRVVWKVNNGGQVVQMCEVQSNTANNVTRVKEFGLQ